MKQNVIITGATSGLGLALAKQFLSQGKIVYGISKTRKHWKSAFQSVGHNFSFKLFTADVSKESEVSKVVRKIIKSSKSVDVLINSAGYINHVTRIEDESAIEFNKNIKMNLFSVFLMCKHVLPFMQKEKKGLIINISSMAGKRAVPSIVSYSASKFGVLAISQCVAKENSDSGIKCFTVCPGGMNTPMRAKVFGKEDAARQQSVDFVADVIMKTISDEIHVDSGGDIVIRHGKVTAINPVPEA